MFDRTDRSMSTKSFASMWRIWCASCNQQCSVSIPTYEAFCIFCDKYDLVFTHNSVDKVYAKALDLSYIL